MGNVLLRVYDGLNELELPIDNLQQLQGEHLPKLISFFSDSESQVFDLYLDTGGDNNALHITVRRYVPLEQLLKLGAALYAAGSMPT
jgi:hypothetical protein